MKIAMAMSGGVDSNVATKLLLDQGHDLIGVTARIYGEEKGNPVERARKTAEHFGIEHRVIDLSQEFEAEIMTQFCSEYLSGKTPSPCIRCNKKIKFGSLLQQSMDLGCDMLATGHYATVNKSHGRFHISRGADTKKDQSYFLFSLDQNQLSRVIFPLGEYSKEEIRRIAIDNNLPWASAEESQEICFIPDNDYKRFIEENMTGASPLEGDIIFTDGRVLKHHRGIYRYTVGQRRGLDISWTEPLYVVDIDPIENKITVGTREHLNKRGLIAGNISFQKAESLNNRRVYTKIRSTHSPKASIIEEGANSTVKVLFDEPITQVSPGQAAVFYDEEGDILGGGWIIKAI